MRHIPTFSVDGMLKDKLLLHTGSLSLDKKTEEMTVISAFADNFFLIGLENVLKNSLSHDFTD